MSTLKTNTIQHLTSGFNNVVAHTDGAGTANAVHARAWVNFNGTGTIVINNSFNVTSITDTDVGYYVVNLTNALSDGNYAAIASASDNATLCGISPGRETKTSSSFSVVTREVAGSGNRYDPTQVMVSVFR